MSAKLHTLSNGFRVVTEHMPGVESASVGVWVTVGGRHERPEQNGSAHFLEHMAFKGTGTRTAQDIAEEIANVGGHINAYTSREATAYYARVLRADVPLAVDVIADILLNPVFDPTEIELERGVILQEIGQTHDTPDEAIFDRLQESAYPDQPMGRTILGSAESVSRHSRQDLLDFVVEHHEPGRMILAAAGAVDHDTLARQAEALFGHLDPAPPLIFKAARYTGGESRMRKDLEQVHFALAFESPGYRDPEVYAAGIHAAVLGGDMSSRLFQEIRERRGLCYSIFAQANAYADTGLTAIYAGTGAGEAVRLASLVVDELKRSAGDISEAEIARARAQMRAGMLMELESPSNRTERLARMVSVWGYVPDVSETLAKIDAVTPAMAQECAERVVACAAPTLALHGPIGTAPDLAGLRDRLAA